MQVVRLLCVSMCLIWTVHLPNALAQKADPSTSNIASENNNAQISLEEKLAELKEKMKSRPGNLDSFFTYAKITSAAGRNDEAEKAYLHMLKVNPNLGRVKLDLALLYLQTERFLEAQKIFDDVAQTPNLPPKVRDNIAQLMKIVENGLKKHVISGTLMVGYNHNSNANSASSSDQTTFNNVSIPLSADNQSRADGQRLAVALLKHEYRVNTNSKAWKMSLNSTGTLYRTYQNSLNNLEIFLASIKVGPEFDFRNIDTKMGFSFSQNYTELDSYKFLTTPSGEFHVDHALTKKLNLQGSFNYEYRKFFNSPSTLTHTNRRGNAWEVKGGVNYAITPRDVINITPKYRNEMAREAYNANHQRGLDASYTHQFKNGITTAASAGIKLSRYKAPDPTVSSTIIRNNRERTMGLNISKPLPHNMALILGYQYKNSESNIQNYDYTDHKYTSAVSWSF